jgi:hypothetical protein
MPRNKPRLVLALYPRPKHPGTYHYTLFLTAKNFQGTITKHHAKNTLLVDSSGAATAPWRYERVITDGLEREQRLLVCVVVAKVLVTVDELERVLAGVPVGVNGGEGEGDMFDCRMWIRDAWTELRTRGAVSAEIETWDEVERLAKWFVDLKRSEGRWDGSWKGDDRVPTIDLLSGKEMVV